MALAIRTEILQRDLVSQFTRGEYSPRHGPRRRVLLALVALLVLISAASWALPARAVTPLNNREYIAAVRKLVQSARTHIYLMLYQARYYEEYPDTETNHLLRDLIEAKLRGVDVKILIDTGSWNPSNKNEYNLDFVDRLTTAGIEVWEDSPEDVSHEKVILVDDNFTVVSSHNWTYYSIAKNNEVAVLIDSQPINEFFRQYFLMRSREGKPLRNAKGAPEWSPNIGRNVRDLSELGFRPYPVADVEPLTNRKFFPTMHEALLSATRSVVVVQRSITLQDRPRLSKGQRALPGQPASEVNVLVDDLIAAHRRGVDVTVVLDQTEGFEDSSNDVTAEYLKSHGVRVLRDDLQNQTHAKLVIVDDDLVSVGSTNWTAPAFESGNEASVLIRSPELNKVYRDYVNALLEHAAPYQKVSKDIWTTPTARRAKP